MTYTEHEILRQTAGMVATALGDGWAVDTDPDKAHWNASILGPDDAALFLSTPWNAPDKVEITGGFGSTGRNDLPYGLKHTRIRVSRGRGPEAIAKEIRRRLLPEYLGELEKVRVSRDQDAVALAARQALAARLGGQVREDATRVYLDVADGYGDLRINYAGESVVFDRLSVSAEIAVKIAELVR